MDSYENKLDGRMFINSEFILSVYREIYTKNISSTRKEINGQKFWNGYNYTVITVWSVEYNVKIFSVEK